MNDKESRLEAAMQRIGRTLKGINDEERAYLAELQKQIDEVAGAEGEGFDRKSEFCYGIIFAPDKIKNEGLIKAARYYVNIVEGKDEEPAQ